MALKTTSPQPLHNKAVQDEPQIHTEAEVGVVSIVTCSVVT